MSYDSTNDTLLHIERVAHLLHEVEEHLWKRANVHDASKLEDPEKAIFDEFTPRLKTSTYGSEEYKGFLEGMGEALQHHYAHNRHHPEHFENGILDMNLLDVIEMLADWKAATERHDDGDLGRSITQNAKRFDYGSEIELLLRNTARDLGWL